MVFLFGGFDEPESRSHVFHDNKGQRRLFVGSRIPPEVEREQREEDERLMYVALTRAQARLYVPYLGETTPSPTAEAPLGSHRVLEDALRTLLDETDGPPSREGPPGFEIEDCPEVPYRATTYLPPEATERLHEWVVPPSPVTTASAAVDINALRDARRGPTVTSYSRLKSEEKTDAFTPEQQEADEVVAETRTTAEDETRPGSLPAGAATGRLLHELLEVIDLDVLRAAENARTWADLPQVIRACSEGLTRHGLPDEAKSEALSRVYTAFTVPLQLGPDLLTGGVMNAHRVIRELEFLYPARDRAGRAQALVKGFIDVVFEHAGRVYVLDWKSDALPSYAPEKVDSHVRDHYLLQAELYTLAVVRLLKLEQEADYERRFGGAAYAFLRALDPGAVGRGQWFWRPSFNEVEATTARLEERFESVRAP